MFHRALQINNNYAEALNNLGVALKNLGRLQEAEARYRRALEIVPHVAELHSNLGTVLERQGQFPDAIACYEQAIKLKPANADAWYNLGHLHQTRDKLDDAVRCYREVLRIIPNHLETLNNFAAVLCRKGQYDDAVWCLQEALRHRPDYADTHYNLATAYCQLGKVEEAVACFREAVRLNPDHSEAHAALGVMLEGQGEPDQALASFGQAMKLRPHDHLRILMAACLPVVHQSMAELEYWRDRACREIRALRESQFVFDLTEIPRRPLFLLAYHGRNDRDIQREAALLYRAPQPLAGLSARLAAGGKERIRVGFISANFNNHTIGHLMLGLVAQLSRADFAVTVLSVGRHDDDMAKKFKRLADCYLDVPQNLPAARQFIADQRLDILFYTDIGMDPVTSTLAFSRLAPVQCVTWGHPVTTGIGTVDYFISSKQLESEDAEQQYTETLVQLQTLPIYYYKPSMPSPQPVRKQFGLAKDDHVYACPQTLQKFHPDFDAVLGGILRGDPRGTLVLIKPARPHWEQLLRRRFATTLPDVVDRIRFMPVLTRPMFFGLLAVTDVLLDPIHFGGGNTTYEGLAVGTPIVTLPSNLLRGRITFALYKQMNLPDCVTGNRDDYIALALRLGQDSDYRDAIRQRILASNSVLFENSKGIRELEQFFRDVVKR